MSDSGFDADISTLIEGSEKADLAAVRAALDEVGMATVCPCFDGTNEELSQASRVRNLAFDRDEAVEALRMADEALPFPDGLDLEAMTHRMNNWGALCDERDALKAKLHAMVGDWGALKGEIPRLHGVINDLNRQLVTMRAELEQAKRERDGRYLHVLPEAECGYFPHGFKTTVTPPGLAQGKTNLGGDNGDA